MNFRFVRRFYSFTQYFEDITYFRYTVLAGANAIKLKPHLVFFSLSWCYVTKFCEMTDFKFYDVVDRGAFGQTVLFNFLLIENLNFFPGKPYITSLRI